MIYDIVMNVVKPPTISMRKEVLLSLSLKKRSKNSLIYPFTRGLFFKLNQRENIYIRMSLLYEV